MGELYLIPSPRATSCQNAANGAERPPLPHVASRPCKGSGAARTARLSNILRPSTRMRYRAWFCSYCAFHYAFHKWFPPLSQYEILERIRLGTGILALNGPEFVSPSHHPGRRFRNDSRHEMPQHRCKELFARGGPLHKITEMSLCNVAIMRPMETA